MPVYNAERYVAAAIESILQQTFSDFELIIINDGATDRSRDIARSFADPRIVHVDHAHNIGLARSLNRGMEMARGEYIARQDADDLSRRNRLARQVAFLDRHPDVVLLGTRVGWIDERRRPLRFSAPTLTWSQIRWGLLFATTGISGATAVLRRREVLESVGSYDPEFQYANDAELHSRIVWRFRAANLSDPLYLVRVHGRQMGKTLGDLPRREAERLALRNMLAVLNAGSVGPPAQWDASEDDLLALRALYTLDPACAGRLPQARSRRLLLTLLQRFRRACMLHGSEWMEFRRALSREWTAAAHVHLLQRPGFAAWLWWQAVRLHPAGVLRPEAVRFWLKWALHPAYARWRKAWVPGSMPPA